MPATETAEAAIVALRVDLDPAQGGRVSYARLAEGLLVTWQDVPLYSNTQRKLSFQALLRPDGRISLSYKQIASLRAEDAPTYGVQSDARTFQSLGCRDDLRLANGLTIELRPQPPSALWLTLNQTQGTIGPGQTATAQLRLRWVPLGPGQPASASVLVSSNDPLRPQLRLTVRLSTSQAPHQTFFPLAPTGGP
jgi:hypothetical protein